MSPRAPLVPPLPAPISSRRHPLVQRCRQLAAGRGGDAPAILIDGPHLLQVALSVGWPIELVAVSDEAVRSTGEIGALIQQATHARMQVVPVTAPVLEAMSPVHAPSGIVAIGEAPTWSLDALVRPEPALTVATLDVQDPGNVGAVVRSADAFGATGVACLGASADPFGWKALRGSMGSALRLPVRRERDALAAIHAFTSRGLSLVVAGAHGGIDADTFDWVRPTLLLVGSEGHGVPADLVKAADAVVCIPMRPGVESLNVAVAAGVLLSRAAAIRARGGAR